MIVIVIVKETNRMRQTFTIVDKVKVKQGY